MTKKILPVLTIEQCREIEVEVLKIWKSRACSLHYNPKTKMAKQLQAEFLLGMVAVTDILTNAYVLKKSSCSPKVFFSIMRGDYIE